MHSFVHRANDTAIPVKNLGWLIRHAHEVTRIEVQCPDCLSLIGAEALLLAHLTGNRVYSTTFASSKVLRQWLNRPLFRSTPRTWDGAEF